MKPMVSSGRLDDMFVEPYFDVDEWREVRVRRYVHGGSSGRFRRATRRGEFP